MFLLHAPARNPHLVTIMHSLLSNVTHLFVECCAAGVAPLLMHGWNKTPLVGLGPVPFCRVESINPIVAPQCINVSVQDGGAHVAATVVHGCHLVPGARSQVKLAHTVETLHLVKPTNAVDIAIEEGCVVIGTRTFPVVRHVDPTTSAAVISFNTIRWTAATPATKSQQDYIRQARATDRVKDTRQTPVCSHPVTDLHGSVQHFQTLVGGVGSHQLIGHHMYPEVLFTWQGQPDLHRRNRFNPESNIMMSSLIET